MNNVISKAQAKAIWLEAQGLNAESFFGQGAKATPAAVEHLGYVQIDTISVIERCHHHILFSRIPTYQKKHLTQAQSQDKSVFEYWAHALAYIPSKDFHFFIPDMKLTESSASNWFGRVKAEEVKKVLTLIKKQGAISIRDIQDDVLVEKNHPWGSRKPSKRALQFGFYSGRLVISERIGMLKKYELTERHFGWSKRPKAASEKEVMNYLFERALRSQGIVSVDSICYLANKKKPAMRALLEKKVKKGELILTQIGDVKNSPHFVTPKAFDQKIKIDSERVHILSPFDPLVIQRKRLGLFFDYEHRFEAYIPKEKRIFGYFALPVVIGDQVVALIDLKTDRDQKKLLVQQFTWLGKHKSKLNNLLIETELHRFEKFQLQ
ncbi:MAG: winged helix-turn-helix domain-containing protein [Pseudobdellovibrionaceae bacterium]